MSSFNERVKAHRLELAQRNLSETKAAIARAETELRLIRPHGEFYLTMQHRILASPDVMEAWQTFLISVQLVASKPIPGITH